MGRALGITAFCAVVATAGALLASACYHGTDTPSARQFQKLGHGIGLGPAPDMSSCTFGFDLRLDERCTWGVGPVPAGEWLCPVHGCSVLTLRSLEPSPVTLGSGAGDRY